LYCTFKRWWSEQSEDLKTIIVHSLVGARRCGEEKEAGEESPAARTWRALSLLLSLSLSLLGICNG
jgi:hypothetical protein